MLDISKLVVAYGQAVILQGVDFTVRRGEVLALLGRNGAGKSTTLKSIMGLVRPVSGQVRFSGKDITGAEPYKIARQGIGYVPEERRIFAELTVMENLEIGRQGARDGRAWTEAELFEIFPNLGRMRARRGGAMSGGEQQMLTIARTLMGNPSLVLLDEPSEGLSPLIVEQMAEAIQLFKKRGITVLLAEQNLHFTEYLADDAVIMEKGRIVWSGGMKNLMADTGLQERYLAV
ncbi:ABC transporter ATP-binding protein [Acidocella sp.]|uniref:ABC transporter ATP-binding protein n=1 Tax=Acidocella sp. TaxID=50710 RepID=UPI003D03EBE1